MQMKFICHLLNGWNGTTSFVRLLLPRCLGLRTGHRVRVGGGIEWPLGNVRNIQLGENVSLGKRGWFYLPLDNGEARIEIGSGTAIGDNFAISSSHSICIGRDCLIGYRVSILDF